MLPFILNFIKQEIVADINFSSFTKLKIAEYKLPQPVFTFPKSTIESPEQRVDCAQS